MDTNEVIYGIIKRVRYDEQFKEINAIQEERLERLRQVMESFTPEQVRAVSEYLDVREVMRDIMLKIALQDENPVSETLMKWLFRDK